jgi:hypothetical protein
MAILEIVCNCLLLLNSICNNALLSGQPSESATTDMTLSMFCEEDSVICRQQSTTTNWLEAKKAEKARHSAKPAECDRLATELDAYLSEPNIEEHDDPLSWWNSKQSTYPSVAVVARVYLGIPATSVASERIFSKCGRVCSERRSLLSPQHIEQLVFLSHNLQ